MCGARAHPVTRTEVGRHATVIGVCSRQMCLVLAYSAASTRCPARVVMISATAHPVTRSKVRSLKRWHLNKLFRYSALATRVPTRIVVVPTAAHPIPLTKVASTSTNAHTQRHAKHVDQLWYASWAHARDASPIAIAIHTSKAHATQSHRGRCIRHDFCHVAFVAVDLGRIVMIPTARANPITRTKTIRHPTGG